MMTKVQQKIMLAGTDEVTFRSIQHQEGRTTLIMLKVGREETVVNI
jgi:ribosomal protein L25 (general stress protein Ctc)